MMPDEKIAESQVEEEAICVQVVGSEASWQKIAQIRLGWWLRPFLFIAAVLLVAFNLSLWVFLCLVRFIHVMTGGWLRPIHRLKLRLERLVRWLGLLSVTSLIAVISPSMGLTLLASYCLMHAYDFPDRWLRLLSRFDTRRF